MKKIILVVAFTGLGFIFANAQNGITKSTTTQSSAVSSDKTAPSKSDVKENKKDNCSPEEKKNCSKKSKACCAHKSDAKS